MTQNEVRYAGFTVRSIADLVDSLILDLAVVVFVLVGFGLYYWLGYFLGTSQEDAVFSVIDQLNSYAFQLLLVGSRVVFSLFYYTACVYFFETTPGKALLKIYVVPESGIGRVTLRQSLIRCLSYLPSYLFFGVGFILVIFQRQKRALHDLIAGTVCVIKRPQENLIKDASDEEVQV